MEPKHPAAYPQYILDLLDKEIPKGVTVFDPMGGVGTLAKLSDRTVIINELEPLWANQATDCAEVFCEDARKLPIANDRFDWVVTSPTYGNRLADKDASQKRKGTAEEKPSDKTRRTYRGFLGQELAQGNTGGLQWGDAYRTLHRDIWREVFRITKPGGTFILNIKDHVRGGVLQKVSEWHDTTLQYLGFTKKRQIEIHTSGTKTQTG
jgi:hypothetical protein